MDHFIDVLNFLQAISWPLVALCIFRYFAPPLKTIMNSVNAAVQDRGLKLSSPQGLGVEIPGNQEEAENIKEFITKATPKKYIKSKQDKTHLLEPLQEVVASTTQTVEEVLETHEASLVNDVYLAINTYLNENKEQAAEKELLKGLLCDAYICLYFERTFQIIIPSQLALLQKLKDTLGGMPEKEVRVIYQLHSEQHPNISFEKWLSFLHKSQLIKNSKNMVTISNEGKEFLEYIAGREYTSKKIG